MPFLSSKPETLFTIEKEKLKNMIGKSLVYNNSPELDEVYANLIPQKGVKINDVSEGSLAVVARFKKDYFIDFSVEEERYIVLTTIHYDQLRHLRGSKIEVSLDGENLLIQSVDSEMQDTFSIEAFDLKNPEAIKLPTDEVKEGYIPKGSKLLINLKVDPNYLAKLQDLGDERYDFEFDGGSWTVEVEDIGTITRTIPTHKIENFTSLQLRVSKDYFDSVISCLEEFNEIWVQGNKDMLFFHGKDENMQVSYVIAGME